MPILANSDRPARLYLPHAMLGTGARLLEQRRLGLGDSAVWLFGEGDHLMA